MDDFSEGDMIHELAEYWLNIAPCTEVQLAAYWYEHRRLSELTPLEVRRMYRDFLGNSLEEGVSDDLR